MPTVEELERSGVIATLETELGDTNRITFTDDDWKNFLSKINTLQSNHAKANLPGGLYGPLRREFMKVVGVEVSTSFIGSVVKLNYKPYYRTKNAPGFRFVAWILALPDDYVVPVEMIQCATHHHLTVRAVPSETTTKQTSAFEAFVNSHAHEIQAPLINAWKEITSFYNIDVVLASLHRMGLNDAAIAALSKAAAG